jgi:hypothetical protein
MDAIPQKAAGSRTLPAASLPKPIGEPQAAMSAASPPLLPPDVRVRSYGLFVRPNSRLSLSKANSRSGRLVFASGTAPAAQSLCTSTASLADGAASERSGGAHSSCDFDRILNAERHSVERSLRPRPFGKNFDHRLDRGIHARNLVQVRVPQFRGGYLAFPDHPGHSHGGVAKKFVRASSGLGRGRGHFAQDSARSLL